MFPLYFSDIYPFKGLAPKKGNWFVCLISPTAPFVGQQTPGRGAMFQNINGPFGFFRVHDFEDCKLKVYFKRFEDSLRMIKTF